METDPRIPSGCPQPLTPERKWIARAGELQGTVTERGIFGACVPFGPVKLVELIFHDLFNPGCSNNELDASRGCPVVDKLATVRRAN